MNWTIGLYTFFLKLIVSYCVCRTENIFSFIVGITAFDNGILFERHVCSALFGFFVYQTQITQHNEKRKTMTEKYWPTMAKERTPISVLTRNVALFSDWNEKDKQWVGSKLVANNSGETFIVHLCEKIAPTFSNTITV